MIELLKRASFFIAIGIVVILFLFFTGKEPPIESPADNSPLAAEDFPLTEENPARDDEGQIVVIDLKGAVANPGVYEIHAGARVNDAIDLAGGFVSDADQSQVNLAQKVQDEMVIHIPVENGESSASAPSTAGNAEGKVRVNYATQAEMESLPGIGPSKAEAILKHRDEHGFFRSAEDLLEVPGIGEKTLDNLKEHLLLP